MKNYKIIKLIISFSLFITLLSGCSLLEKEETKTFEISNNQGTIETIVTYKGERVIKQQTTNKLNFSSGEIDKNFAERSFNELQEKYNNIDGITITTNFITNEASQTITFDFEKIDKEKLKTLAGFTKLLDKNSNITISQLETNLSNEGFKIKNNK